MNFIYDGQRVQKTLEDSKEPARSHNDIFRQISYNSAKQIVISLQRTVRWNKYLDQDKIYQYMKIIPQRDFEDVLEPEVKDDKYYEKLNFHKNRILQNMTNNNKWKGHLDENNKLIGTLPIEGNTFHHTKNQTKLFKQYGPYDLANGLINKQEYDLLEKTSKLHDLGESVFGDVIAYNKTDNHTKLEYEFGLTILKDLIRKNLVESEKENIYQSLKEAYNVSFINDLNLESTPRQKEISEIFKLYENYGYISGAILAQQNADLIKDSAHLNGMSGYNAAFLIYAVLTRTDFEKMLQMLPSAKLFLLDNSINIDKCFDFIKKSYFLELDGQKDKLSISEKKQNFLKALVAWQLSKQNLK